MKVIPYISPCYFGSPTGGAKRDRMPEFLSKVRSVLSQYGFDGVYFDELYRDDKQGSCDLVRQVRRMIGDSGILYIHAPYPAIPCPFINTYATYILNGEHRSHLPDWYSRYVVSDYNVGNSIGTFCYDADRPSSGMIDRLLSYNARLPYWVQDLVWDGKKVLPDRRRSESYEQGILPEAATFSCPSR